MKRFQHICLWLSLRDWTTLLPWLIAACLCISAAVAHLALVRPEQRQLSSQTEALKTLSHASRQPHSVQPLGPSPSPVYDTLAQFPALDTAPDVLGTLDRLASKHQIATDKLALDWVDEPGLPVTRAEFTLAVKADELRMRRFLAAARHDLPTLAVSRMVLRRDSTTVPTADVEVRLAIYFRRGV